MSKGKYQSRGRGFNVRPVAVLLAVVLLIGASVGGTIAWLTAKTEDVVNTFTVGDVAITLKETPINWTNDDYTYGDAQVKGQDNTYKMIPGETYVKDPVVTVTAKSEDCWLFVQFEKGTKTDTYIEYTSLLKSPDWTKLENAGVDGEVWYRAVDYSEEDQSFELLGGTHTVDGKEYKGVIKINSDAVTKTTMADAAANSSLKYTAYAIQRANIKDVATAWEQAKTAQASGGTQG